MAQYGDDEELWHVKSDAIQLAVEAWSKVSPTVPRWTKHTVPRRIKIGDLGATVVGTPGQVADQIQRWVAEADVDGFNLGVCSHAEDFRGCCWFVAAHGKEPWLVLG
jgi:alkanesulfonate monooxygenase SsuD/methylene tetrahydromethanopterin reductase-like flavin-dependent oxidoreductase (luciferase family)